MAVNNNVTIERVEVPHKSRGVYILLAFLLGYLGAHKFYVNKVGTGVLYLILLSLSWLVIPLIILTIAVFVDIVSALMDSDDEFNSRYGSMIPSSVVTTVTSVNTSVGKDSYLDEIERLNELKEKGLISDKEFEAKKKLILFSNSKEK